MTRKVAIIGCGFIGRAWAITYARAGCSVALYDIAPAAAEKALSFIDSVLGDLAANDLLRGQTPAEVRQRITPAKDLAEALQGAYYVQENSLEQLDVKQEVFAQLDAAAAPETILASSTSAILPSRFTETLKNRQRCIVVHPINPPYLVPAAEVVPAPWTDPKVVEATAAFQREVGQAPIVMKKEIDGFVMNRMQGALLQEAFRLVAEGYASTEDVDIGIRDGLGLRWAFMGPFETIDLNAPQGVAEYIDRYEGLYKTLWQTQGHIVPWGGKLKEQITGERVAKLPRTDLLKHQTWRDRRLMALVAHKNHAKKSIPE